jgi:hypothetical protein
LRLGRGLAADTPMNADNKNLEAVDEAGDVAGAEAVVDIDDGDVAGATVEHAEQGGEAVEAGAIADAGGDGDDGAGYKAADGAGERPFHAGADDDDAGLGEALAIVHEAMDAGDPDIVDGIDGIAHDFGGKLGLFGDGHVAGAGADDGDGALAGDGAVAPEADDAGTGEILALGEAAGDGFGALPVGAGDEDVAGVVEDDGGDFGDLVGRLAFGEDDFGHAMTERPVVVHFGEAEVFKGHMPHARHGGIDVHGALAHLFEESAKLVLVHEARITDGPSGAGRRFGHVVFAHEY